MPLTLRRLARGALAAFLGLVCTTCLAPDATAVATGLPRAEIGTPGVPDPWDIPQLVVAPFPPERPELQRLATDGTRLFAEDRANGVVTSLVRLDRRTGAVVAEYTFRPPPPGTPYDPAAPYLLSPEVVVLDGDRTEARILDPDTLEVRRAITLPKNTRSALPSEHRTGDAVWIGHRNYVLDTLQERYTRRAMTRLDAEAGTVTETRDVPTCGTKGPVQPAPKRVVLPVESANQIAVMDLATGTTRILPGFQSRPELSVWSGDDVWVRWGDLGYLGRVRGTARRLRTLDLNAGGPKLRSLYGLTAGGGSLWITGIPVDNETARLLYRIDPETMTVTARAWTTSAVTVIGDGGYAFNGTQVGTFDPASVGSAAPTKVVRPKPLRARGFIPTNKSERAVLTTFTRVFDYRVSNAKAAPFLEDAKGLDAIRTRLTTFARVAFESLELTVTDVSVRGNRASVAYTFLLNGSPAFEPGVASLKRRGDRWIVSRASVCRLAVRAGMGEC